MSRRDREIDALKHEVATLRAAQTRDTKRRNALRDMHPECPRCAALAFDLELARETIDALAAESATKENKPPSTPAIAAPTNPPPRFKLFVVSTNEYAEFTPRGIAGYRLYGVQAHSNDLYGVSYSRTWVTLIYELDRPENGPESGK